MKRYFKKAFLLLSMIAILASCSEPDNSPKMNPYLKEIGCILNADGTVKMPNGTILQSDGLWAPRVREDGDIVNPDGTPIALKDVVEEDQILIDSLQGNILKFKDPDSGNKDPNYGKLLVESKTGKNETTITLKSRYHFDDINKPFTLLDLKYVEVEGNVNLFAVFQLDGSKDKQIFNMQVLGVDETILLIDGVVMSYSFG